MRRADRVVVLGSEARDRLFGNAEAIGAQIRIKGISVEVVGVMQPKGSFFSTNQDDAVFIAITTMVNRVTGRTSP